MIQANELRIGNFVNYKWFDKTSVLIDGYPRQKTIIHREILSVLAVDGENNRALIKTKQNRKNQTWVSLGKLTPIPLTEEILLKCGFEKVHSNYEEAETFDFVRGFIWFDMANQSTKLCGNYILGFVPEHLHQLQNLYFALTGKELEFSLT